MEHKDISAKIDFIKAALIESGQSLVVIGMPGAGKTRVGEALAEAFGYNFIDTDAQIVEREGASVAEIFASKGEKVFRFMEFDAVQEALKSPEQIVSVGGGAFFQEATHKAIQDNGLSVWLNVDFDTLYERVKDASHRPLLEQSGDKRADLKDLMEVRVPTYKKAHVHAVLSDEGTANKQESIAQNRDRVINALYNHIKPA